MGGAIVAALLLYLLVQQVENNFFVTKIQGDAIQLHPAAVVPSTHCCRPGVSEKRAPARGCLEGQGGRRSDENTGVSLSVGGQRMSLNLLTSDCGFH